MGVFFWDSEFGIHASESFPPAAPWRFDCESNEKEQRPDRHVHRNGRADLCRNPKHSPAGGSSRRTTFAIILCGPAPLIVLFFLLVLLLILALSFLGNDHCIHTTDSKPHNKKNNNSDSVVHKRPSRSNNSKLTDTPSKQERNTFTSSSNCPTPFRSPTDPKTTQTL